MFLQSSNLYFWCSFLTICKGVQRRTTLSRHSGFLEDTWIRHKKVAPRDTLLETRILLSVAHILIDIKFNFLNFMYNLLQQFESFSFFYFSVLINIDEKIFFFFFSETWIRNQFWFLAFSIYTKIWTCMYELTFIPTTTTDFHHACVSIGAVYGITAGRTLQRFSKDTNAH